MDLWEILKQLSIPRPNHSIALTETANYIKILLTGWGIPFTVQEFILPPYMQLILGITVVLLAVLLFICIWRRWPVAALIISLAIPALLLTEFEGYTPIVSQLVTRTGENIIISFTAPDPARELIFAAHYDSKTDFFDHIQRGRIYAFIPVAFVIGIGLAVFAFFSGRRPALKKKAVTAVNWGLAGLLIAYWGLVFLGFGGYIFIPPERQSYGSVDDGAAVVALLALSRDIHEGRVQLGSSNVTVLLTSGEEILSHGADAYVKKKLGQEKKTALPASVVNLELAGQNGNMIYWQKDGVFIIYHDADSDLIARIGKAWREETGQTMEARDRLTDDGKRFMVAGIPSVTIGNSGLPGLGLAGFHSTQDNIQRLNVDNVKLTIGTLKRYIENYTKD